MMCKMVETDYKSKAKGYKLCVCSRRGCRGHGFMKNGNMPKRFCDNPSLGLGDVVHFFAKWFKKEECETCNKKRKILNFVLTMPLFVLWARPWPWKDPIYRDRLCK